jgi:hypothetical protein
LEFCYIIIGDSHETAAFVIDKLVVTFIRAILVSKCKAILLLWDCGEANTYRQHLFNVLLQNFRTKIGIKIILPVPRTIKPTILTGLEQVPKLRTKTSHSKGLTVKVRIVKKNLPLKQPSNKLEIDEKENLRHALLPYFSIMV